MGSLCVAAAAAAAAAAAVGAKEGVLDSRQASDHQVESGITFFFEAVVGRFGFSSSPSRTRFEREQSKALHTRMKKAARLLLVLTPTPVSRSAPHVTLDVIITG